MRMDEPKQEQTAFFGVVEVMGHNTFAGRVSEMALGGASFIRVDVPEIPERTEARSTWRSTPETYVIPAAPAYTKIIGPGSIYAITPCTEEVARKVADQRRQRPVEVIDMPSPRLLESSKPVEEEEEEERPF